MDSLKERKDFSKWKDAFGFYNTKVAEGDSTKESALDMLGIKLGGVSLCRTCANYYGCPAHSVNDLVHPAVDGIVLECGGYEKQ